MTQHSPPAQPVCYRHPDRPTNVACTRCGRPICPDDMVEAPVGWLCPVCARAGRQPARVRLLGAPPRVTYALLGLIAAGFVAQVTLDGDTLAVTARLATWGLAIDLNGEWWRVVTGGFVHSTGNLLHVLFNGYLLYRLGQLMEPALGPFRFGALYFTSLVGGSLGAVVLAPTSPAIGASGAVFGLMGALLVVYRQRGLNPFRTDIGTLLLLNLVITFVIPRISIGGHIGGLVAGAIVGFLYVAMARTPDARLLSAQLAAALGLLLWIATVVAAGVLIQV